MIRYMWTVVFLNSFCLAQPVPDFSRPASETIPRVSKVSETKQDYDVKNSATVAFNAQHFQGSLSHFRPYWHMLSIGVIMSYDESSQPVETQREGQVLFGFETSKLFFISPLIFANFGLFKQQNELGVEINGFSANVGSGVEIIFSHQFRLRATHQRETRLASRDKHWKSEKTQTGFAFSF